MSGHGTPEVYQSMRSGSFYKLCFAAEGVALSDFGGERQQMNISPLTSILRPLSVG